MTILSMKKTTFFILLLSVLTACSNNTQQIEQAEERARFTKDSLQKIQDSLDVEAKILQDMEASDTGSAAAGQ